MKKYLFVIITILTVFGVSAQFSEDKSKFAKEFQKAVSSYGNGPFMDFVRGDFSEMMEQSNLPDDYFKKMVNVANKMTEKRMSAYPFIYNYVYSVSSFVLQNQTPESFYAWNKAAEELLNGRNMNKYKDFIAFSSLFFSDRILSDKANFNWYYLGGNFAFEYDKKLMFTCSEGRLACKVINKNKNKNKVPFIDSIVIANTSGEYDPIRQKWSGSGGILNWEKVGLDKDKNFAELKTYEVSTRVANFSADSIMLTTFYFKEPIAGRIIDRAFKANRE